jgi:hypothetical protein
MERALRQQAAQMPTGQWQPQTPGYSAVGVDTNRQPMQQRQPAGSGNNTTIVNTSRSGFGADTSGMGQKL